MSVFVHFNRDVNLTVLHERKYRFSNTQLIDPNYYFSRDIRDSFTQYTLSSIPAVTSHISHA